MPHSSFEITDLQIKSEGYLLGVKPGSWDEPFRNAEPDPEKLIRHVKLRGDSSYGYHVAAIPQTVKNHYHADGDEEYSVVDGSGTLYFGRVVEKNGEYVVLDEDKRSVDVKAGDSFVIPEGCAHQLVNTGEKDLIILFACPDSHLDKTQDWTSVPDFI